MLRNKITHFFFSFFLLIISFACIIGVNNYAKASSVLVCKPAISPMTSVAAISEPTASGIASTPVPKTAPPATPIDLLNEVMKRSDNISTIKTNFLQEKHVDFLDAPITTSGQMYFAKNKDSVSSLLWEYNPPSASGIWFNAGTSWVWAQARANLRKPEGPESNFVNSMMAQMIFWLKIDSKKIATQYNLELVAKYAIKLIPKRKDMFKSITVTFSDDLRSLQTLTLEEEKGNSTTLSFFETEYNTPAISAFSDGTPLP